MNLDRLIKQLKSDEGFSASAYVDTLGNWTIGYGCTSHFNGRSITGDTPRITRYMAEKLMFYHIHSSWHRAKRFAHDYDNIPDLWQEAVINMSYQMGNKISKFHKLKQAIKDKNGRKAHDEVLDSLYAKQTPNRAKRVASMFL